MMMELNFFIIIIIIINVSWKRHNDNMENKNQF